MSTRSSQYGLTLVELVVSIVVLSIALVILTQMLGTGLSRSSDTLIELRAASLAEAYLDEILGKRFDENSASGGVPPCQDPMNPGPPQRRCTIEGEFGPDPFGAPIETRATFDDVDDYTNIDEGADGVDPFLRDALGVTRTGYDGFTVVVDVRYINELAMGEESGLGQNNELDDEYDAKLITVTVSHRLLAAPLPFAAYKSNF